MTDPSDSELERLLKENSQLKDLNDTLKEGNLALKDANAALRELVDVLRNGRVQPLQLAAGPHSKDATLHVAEPPISTDDHSVSTAIINYIAPIHNSSLVKSSVTKSSPTLDYARLPQEILLPIFLATIPQRHLHDSSVAAGARSPWVVSLNTRTALTLVCKAWYGPASEALYTDIVFRRMGQISALARTFRSTAVIYAPDRSRFVKIIYMDTCIILPSGADVVRNDLAFVLQRCTYLETFAFRPHLGLDFASLPSDIPWRYVPFNPDWLWNGPAEAQEQPAILHYARGLRELALLEQLEVQHFQSACSLFTSISLFQALTSLTLPKLIYTTRHYLPTLAFPVMQLPQLQELQIHVERDHETLIHAICNLWTFGSLERLTILGYSAFPHNILEKHGARLTHFHLHYLISNTTSWTDDRFDSGLSDLGTLCPRIKHLVLPDLPVHNPQCLIKSETLLHLDLWSAIQKRRVVELMCEMGQACFLPSLRTVRILPVLGMRALTPRLPLLYPPEGVDDYEVRVRVLPGVRLLQTSWALLMDYGYQTGVWFAYDWYDSSDGSEYEGPDDGVEDEDGEGEGEDNNHDEVDDDTSWISDPDALRSDEDEFDGEGGNESEGPLVQYDREAILERFCESQKEDFLFDSSDGE